jgi:hypothetical protein
MRPQFRHSTFLVAVVATGVLIGACTPQFKNTAPTANAGESRTVARNTLVTLGGSATDPEDKAFTFAWSLTSKPEGSAAALTGETTATPSFTTDKAGDYVVQLVVNDTTDNSAPATVTITAVNAKPVAAVPEAQTVLHGVALTLSGAESSDPDADPLTFTWTIAEKPEGATGTLADAELETSTFTPDLPGEWVLQLVVNDGFEASEPATVTVTATNTKPVAAAGTDRALSPGKAVVLDGSASEDADDDELSFQWTLASKPEGSAARLEGDTTATPRFTADVRGLYTVSLVVNDGFESSVEDTIVVEATDFVAVAFGPSVSLRKLVGDELVEVGTASLPATGILPGHTFFSFAQHPTRPWLYATSTADWQTGDRWGWGNGRIDRFRVSGTGLVYDGAAFKYDVTSHPSAALAPCSTISSDFEGQVGQCAPVTGVFSPDGTRFFVQEDYADKLNVFAVDPDTGDLTLVALGAPTNLHGLVGHPTAPYLYNGGRAIHLLEDGSTELTQGSSSDAGGNGGLVAGEYLFATNQSVNELVAYSLADPAAPVRQVALGIGPNQCRAFAANQTQSRFVAVGRDSVATVAFDGAGFTLENRVTFEEAERVENRSVTFVDGDRRAVVAWFQRDTTKESTWNGGFSLYSISADGQLASTAKVELGGPSRVVSLLNIP